MVRLSSKKISYEMFKGKKPSHTHFKVFGTHCFVHINDKRHSDKFEAKSEPKIFFGYSKLSRAYRIFNLKHECIEESLHVVFDEVATNHPCRNEDNDELIMDQEDSEAKTKSKD